MPELRCDSVRFFSPEDEAAFFNWASRIVGVSGVRGEDRSIVIELGEASPSEDTLRELLALSRRYQVPAKQLARFLSDENASWFRDPRAYWYAEVFGHDR
jgi:hypothetical protein